jgi:hypothetical protein
MFDIGFIASNIARLKRMSLNAQSGAVAIRESSQARILGFVLCMLYVAWQLPGNVMYYSQTVDLGYLGQAALFLLFCGYIFMLVPCIAV